MGVSNEKNTFPAITAAAGGIFIIIQGLFMLLIPLSYNSISEMNLFYGALTTILGLAALVLSYSIYVKYKLSNSLAVLSIAVIVMLFAGGGFLVGSMLTSVSGTLSLMS